MSLLTLAALGALGAGAVAWAAHRRARAAVPPLDIDPPSEWQTARRGLVARAHRDPDGAHVLWVAAGPGGDLVVEAGPEPRADAPFDRAVAIHTDDWPHVVDRLDTDQRRALARAVEHGARYADGRWTLCRDELIPPSDREALADVLFDAADAFAPGVSPMWALEHLDDDPLSSLGWPLLLCALERGHPDAPATARAAQRSSDPEVRARADEALDPIRRRAALLSLARARGGRPAQPTTRAAAIEALACGDNAAPDADRAALRAIIDHALGPRGHHEVRSAAFEAALRIGHTPFAEFTALARHPDRDLRRMVGRALHHARPTDEAALVSMLAIAWPDLEGPIATALGRIGGPPALRALDAHRRAAAEAFGTARAAIRERLAVGRLAVVGGAAGGLSVTEAVVDGQRPAGVSGLDAARARAERTPTAAVASTEPE